MAEYKVTLVDGRVVKVMADSEVQAGVRTIHKLLSQGEIALVRAGKGKGSGITRTMRVMP